jgi:hypothetical protein
VGCENRKIEKKKAQKTSETNGKVVEKGKGRCLS